MTIANTSCKEATFCEGHNDNDVQICIHIDSVVATIIIARAARIIDKHLQSYA